MTTLMGKVNNFQWNNEIKYCASCVALIFFSYIWIPIYTYTYICLYTLSHNIRSVSYCVILKSCAIYRYTGETHGYISDNLYWFFRYFFL